ncbi:hypothetical protein [Actinophytocola sp.]|uniref:hypothetical protein n=1 Tax=Actinophytocola sp. TaxID=1872138 RepID=UPI002D8052DD|nr:hypothetical protein [Actinophytocola sp.]HET9144042.1 hypothetical protein [Actinophytocola sp.]
MSEENPTVTPFLASLRDSSVDLLVTRYRRSTAALLRLTDPDARARRHRRMDAITIELVERGLGELASDLNDEWAALDLLAKADPSHPVAAVIGSGLATIRLRIQRRVALAPR